MRSMRARSSVSEGGQLEGLHHGGRSGVDGEVGSMFVPIRDAESSIPIRRADGACYMFRSLLGAATILVLAAAPASAQQRAYAVDGDTLRVGRERVRIVGLDTPEMRGQCPRERAMARQARDRMAQLVAGGVRLSPSGRDRYGRMLAVVRDSRGRDVAQVMIREGLPRPYEGGRRAGWCGTHSAPSPTG
ncbi:thermonuclease family protein [Rhodovarius lipocyclicus]|uniref:thermonuclease family protein n=1 Tax=Rhodovarius lipocyclicus TaxID=268410 RepID=UPI0038B563FA